MWSLWKLISHVKGEENLIKLLKVSAEKSGEIKEYEQIIKNMIDSHSSSYNPRRRAEEIGKVIEKKRKRFF